VPSFSVIIAAYQAADTIADAVRSALDQTTPPLEVIVCDDGSTDATAEALSPFNDQIVLLRREHRGEGPARQAATRAASGDFVVVLDADDACLPRRVEALGEAAAARPDLDIITTDAWLELDGRALKRFYEWAEPFEVADQRRVILERNFIFIGAAVRRRRLLEVGGWPSFAAMADWYCWMRLLHTGSTAGLVAEPLYRYRIHEGALSAEGTARNQLKTLTRARDLHLDPEGSDVLERSIARHELAAERERARESLLSGGRDARRRSIVVARRRDNDARTRIKAACAAAAPRIAARVLRARRTGAAGVRLSRDDGRI
jgi:glycosyltransferase involved in cell wall biosynthesis